MYSGTLTPIEQAELNTGLVGDTAHQPVQRIDLAHQMALADTANSGVARHFANGLGLMRHQ